MVDSLRPGRIGQKIAEEFAEQDVGECRRRRRAESRAEMAEIVLCVAEKPSLAGSIATFLARGVQIHPRTGGPLPVHEFDGSFRGRRCR